MTLPTLDGPARTTRKPTLAPTVARGATTGPGRWVTETMRNQAVPSNSTRRHLTERRKCRASDATVTGPRARAAEGMAGGRVSEGGGIVASAFFSPCKNGHDWPHRRTASSQGEPMNASRETIVTPTAGAAIRDRVREFRRVPAGEL